jgi:dynein heavy chain, axonemal
MRATSADIWFVFQALVSHCEQWVTKFSLLLHEIATDMLSELSCYLSSNAAKLRVTPSNLDELAQVVNLQKRLDSERRQVQDRFEPLQHMFATLEKVLCCPASS